MKYSVLFAMFLTMVTLSSCSAIEGVFKAGMYWAFFLVALVVALILWLVMRARK